MNVRFKLQDLKTSTTKIIKIPIDVLNKDPVTINTYKALICDAENKLMLTNNTEPTLLSFDQYMIWTIPSNLTKNHEKIIMQDPKNRILIKAKLTN